jgi:hypothetical protein
MQNAIDSFRAKTGGNLTEMSYPYLQNTTLVFYTPPPSGISKRDVDFGFGDAIATDNSTQHAAVKTVSGIQAFAESLMVPSAK